MCIAGICKFCKAQLLLILMLALDTCLVTRNHVRKKVDHAAMVQTRLVLNHDGSYRNRDYDPQVVRTELCRLIVKLDLPLGIVDT